MKTIKLDTIRPIWGIEDDNVIVSKIGSYSKMFKLTLPPIFSLSEDDYDRCVNEFNSIFSIIPDYVMIHKMDVYTKRNYSSSTIANPNEDFLKDAYKRKFNEAPYIDHVCYLTISQTSPSIKKNTSFNSLVFKNRFIAKELKSAEVYNEFQRTIERVKSILNESFSFDAKELNKEEILVLCNKYESLNFSDFNFSSDIYQDQRNTKIGTNYVSALAINSLDCLPNEFDSTFVDIKYSTDVSSLKFSLFHPIGLGFKENHIVNQVWLKESMQLVKNELKNIDNLNKTCIAQDTSNPLNLQDSAEYSFLMDKGNIPVSYHCNVIIWDADSKALELIQNKLLASFNSIKFIPNIAWNEILPLYWSCYPGNIADLGYIDQMFKLIAIQSSSLAIYETTRTDNVSDFGLFFSNRDNGIPVYVDISDLPMSTGVITNRNKMIIGPSGSGKSFTTNHFVNSYLDYNTHMVIVDVGDSYQRLCELRGGKYLKFTESSPISFNPFFINTEDFDKSELGGTKVSLKNKIKIEAKDNLITLIFTLWKKNVDDATKDEQAIIREGLNEYYDHIEVSNEFMCFNSYYRFMVDVYFPKMNNVKESTLMNATSFTNVLKMFYEGNEYDYLLNSTTNIDLINDKFIVFELDNIQNHPILYPVVTLMIMDVFLTKMRFLKGTRKVLLLEEAWKAITNQGMAEFIKYLFKTIRKHFGEVWIVTQELKDILENPIVKETVVSNCPTKILLDMGVYKSNFDQIQSVLALSNKAKELILSINKNNIKGFGKHKEVFIGLGDTATVYGLNVSREEYYTYTTEKPEIEAINDYSKKFGNLELAIKIKAQE